MSRRTLLLAVPPLVLTAALGSTAVGGAATAGPRTATLPTTVGIGPVAVPVGVPGALALAVPVARGLGPTGGLLPPVDLPGWTRVEAPTAAAPVDEDAARLATGTGPGSPREAVAVVQRLLNRAGAGLEVDGDWGPATTRALRAVQLAAGLPADGRLGPATAEALRAL